jgi:hypothetical protein
MPAAPATVALYLTDLAEVAKTSTVERRIASIAFGHRAAGQLSPTDDPTVKAVWAGIRRVHGTAEDQAAPISVPLLRRMIAALPPGESYPELCSRVARCHLSDKREEPMIAFSPSRPT